jgi:hypothetical protein
VVTEARATCSAIAASCTISTVDEETTRNVGYMDGNTEGEKKADSIEDVTLDVID